MVVLAAVPLFIRTAAFAQCQGGSEGELNQKTTEDLGNQLVQPAMMHVVAALKSNTFPEFTAFKTDW